MLLHYKTCLDAGTHTTTPQRRGDVAMVSCNDAACLRHARKACGSCRLSEWDTSLRAVFFSAFRSLWQTH